MSLGGSQPFLPSGKDGLRNRQKEAPKLPHLSESPFKRDESVEPDNAGEEIYESTSGYDFDGFQTYPTTKIWSDLLLDISMTTTFNSLTNGTEVIDPETCISYLFFFTLVWWIWASQVCYDVRFTKADWVHRLSVFLQFIVFCALAAFTKDFDIGYKLSSSTSIEKQVVANIQTSDGFSKEEINAAQFREDRLPILNARGISLVMMFSRVLLLLQYLLTLIHAPADNSRDSPLFRMWVALTGPGFRAFQTHILSLTLSATSYLVSFIILNSSIGENKGAQVAKVILWFLPIVWEIVAHFFAMKQRGHVKYPEDRVFDRSAASFIIILGGGLDKITEGFQLIVGNVSIGSSGTGLVLAGAISFITQFALYFEMTKGRTITRRKSRFRRRVLAWLIAHFVYFSSLIIMLQAIAALLKSGSIGKALNLPLQFAVDAARAIEDAGEGQFITADSFDDIASQVKQLGLNLEDLVDIVNDSVSIGLESNSSVLWNGSDFDTPAQQVAFNGALQASTILIYVILDNFEVTPDPSSFLGSEIDLFIDVDANDTTSLNGTFDDMWTDIAERALTTEAIPALWFYGSAGLTLISLSALGLIKWWGELDSYRRTVLSIRLVAGITTCLLSFVDTNQGDQILKLITDKHHTKISFTLGGAAVWSLASKSLLIPIFSIIISCEQLAELIIIFVLQKRAKSNTGTAKLGGANIGNISTVASFALAGQSETFDPYKENFHSTVSIALGE